MTAGQTMFSVTGAAFTYEQAPGSMKSVVTAFWMLAGAVGNLIVIIIAETLKELFNDKQSHELLFYAILMLLDVVIFIVFARRYKSSNVSKIDPEIGSKEQNIPLNTSERSSIL